MFNVTDLNGKEISFTLDQLQDMNSNIFNSAPHKTSINPDFADREINIYDWNGEVTGTVGDVQKILDSNGGELPKALDVEIEATHSGDNHNYAIYHSDSMEEDAKTFLYPYRKPLLKNHDSHSEPLGRMTDSTFGESDIVSDRDTIKINVRVNDADAIQKFLDGRYRTVSIGGRVGHIKCNICGKDILKDKKVKFCGHWKGQKYGDQVSLWHTRDITYTECSVVNNPADDWAQVVKIKLVDPNSKDNEDNEGKSPEENQDNLSNEGIIDHLLDNDPEKNPLKNNEDNKEGEKDPKDPEEPKDPDNDDPKAKDDEGKDNNDIEALKTENDSLKAEIETLKTENESLKDEVLVKTEDMSLSDAAKEKAQKDCKEATDKMVEYKNISVKLAKANKELLKDQVILYRKSLGEKVKLEDSEELLALSAKDLRDKVNEYTSKFNNSNISKVPNPGIVDNKGKYSIDDDKDDSDKEPEKKAESNKTNVVDSIVNRLCK